MMKTPAAKSETLPTRQGNNAYVGFKSCGCMVAVVFDDPKFKKDTATTVAEFIESGLNVQHVVWKTVQKQIGTCKCAPK